MFSIARLYNPACSYATNTIRINPIMMSIVLYQYKILKEKNFDNYFYYDSNDIDNSILKSEIEKLNNFSSVLRKQNQELFREMLQSSYKYSNAINAKGEEYSTESLIMSLLLERYK